MYLHLNVTIGKETYRVKFIQIFPFVTYLFRVHSYLHVYIIFIHIDDSFILLILTYLKKRIVTSYDLVIYLLVHQIEITNVFCILNAYFFFFCSIRTRE